MAAILASTCVARAEIGESVSSCLPAAASASGAVEDARSVRLADGRMLRLAGIETFAILAPDGDRAEAALRDELRRLTAGAKLSVRILAEAPDRYGRLLALVAAEDGTLLQVAAARAGLAVAFAAGDTVPCFDRIAAAEDAARRTEAGFWKSVALPPAEPTALVARIGRFAIFEGRVVSVGNRPQRTYLNFGTRWSEDVTVSVRKRDREAFGGEAGLARLAGKRLRVRGFLEEHGGPSLEARSPQQIEVLDEVSSGEGGGP